MDNIKSQLDLVLLALEALAGIGSEAMLKVAVELNLESNGRRSRGIMATTPV